MTHGFFYVVAANKQTNQKANTQQHQQRESDFENEEYWIYISIRY